MPLSVELLWIEGERERERETGVHWSFISSTPPQVWVIRQSSNHGCYVVPAVPCRPLQCPQGRRGSFHLTSHTQTHTHTHIQPLSKQSYTHTCTLSACQPLIYSAQYGYQSHTHTHINTLTITSQG